MLYIRVAVGEHHVPEEWCWSVSGKVRGMPNLLPDFRSVLSVEASGAELLWITQQFKGIPSSPQVGSQIRTVWPNPWAQFIVANLPEKVKESLIPQQKE